MRKNKLFDTWGNAKPQYLVVDRQGLIIARAGTQAEADRKLMMYGSYDCQVMRQDNLFQEGGRI